MTRWIRLICIVAVVMVSACKIPQPPQDLVAVDRAAFDAVRKNDEAALEKLLVTNLNEPDMRARLAEVQALMPAEEPKGRQIVSWQIVFSNGGKTAAVNSEYDYADRIALVQSSLVQPSAGAPWQVQGFHFRIATTKELAVNQLSLSGKSAGHYVFLLGLILSPLLMIAALVKVIRTQGLRRKWLWGILAFVGLFAVRMDWASGQVAINWLMIRIIGFGVLKSGGHFGSWILDFTIPVGALLILTGLWANPARSKANRKATDEVKIAFDPPTD